MAKLYAICWFRRGYRRAQCDRQGKEDLDKIDWNLKSLVKESEAKEVIKDDQWAEMEDFEVELDTYR